MQKVLMDPLRPAGERDAFGVADAKSQLRKAYDMIETDMAASPWAMGEDFTMADCAAAPALFYGRMDEPFGAERPKLTAYLDRLMQRPSYARVLKEAEPYFAMLPK